MQRWAVICWALLALVGAEECPDGGRCEEGNTCCNTPANGYGCCPFDQAECCGDHIHCCPQNTLCDQATSSCVNATASVPWRERTPADEPPSSKSFRMIRTYMGEDEDNICPDQSRCPPEFSCLKALTKFGCCPLAKGVSCSDGKHCCPEGHRCSMDSRSCIRKELVVTVLCGDGVSECPEETTCCETPEGKWGCCPMPKAVCCDDKKHCCPEGTTCDTGHMKCISSSTKKELPMWAKFPARTREDWENQKDGEKEVTAETAQDTDREKNPEANTVPPSKEEVSTESPVAMEDNVNLVPCNDTVACPDDATCCKTKNGGWSCCLLPEAVCCEDFVHCCPKGKKCNLAAQKCEDGLFSVPWLEKIPATPKQSAQVQLKDVPCDDTSACPDDTTCCKTKEGGWACCPLPEAVCCEDFVHCCPKGKKCNLAAQKCEDGLFSVPWLEKVPATPKQSAQVQLKDVPCDDTSACPDGTTCCKTKEGGWACCPLPEAVCCEDFVHCCPKGKKCNVAAQKCEDGLISLPWFEKMPSKPKLGVQMKRVQCDATRFCPDNSTCCKSKDGGWGCCPMPEAVCCEDQVHCCPAGSTCSLDTLSCDTGSVSTPMKEKLPAFPSAHGSETDEGEKRPDYDAEGPDGDDDDEDEEGTEVEGRIQCDSHTSCPQHTTCCFMASAKKWGCCPLPKAVCCADGDHCCPNDYKCTESQTSCVRGEVVIPWYTKIEASSSVQADPNPGSVQCDAGNRCPEHTSCCRLSTGRWGCCPLQNAVCCPDKEHCCPQGYSCDLASMSCHKLILLQLETLPLTPVYLPEYRPPPTQLEHRDVRCDDQTSCNDDETCCRTSATSWGCCPAANAVCCSDMKHCCPTGYTCSQEGSCSQDTGLNWHNWHVFYANKKRALIV